MVRSYCRNMTDYTSVKSSKRLAEVVERAAADGGTIATEIKEWRQVGDVTTLPFSLVQRVHATSLTDPTSGR